MLGISPAPIPKSRTLGSSAGRSRFPRRLRPLILLGAAALVFLPFLGRRDIVTSHEARVAQTARRMAASGWPWSAAPAPTPRMRLLRRDGVTRAEPRHDLPPAEVNPWLVPVLDGQVRLQKPPLPYWCAAALFRLLGVGEAAARLTPALLGVIATLLLFDLVRRLRGPTIAWAAAAVWLSTHFVVDEYRKAMADPFLAFFTLACLWAWAGKGSGFGLQGSAGEASDGEQAGEGAGEARPSRSAWSSLNPESRTLSLLLLFYFCLGLGVLAKGPVVFVHVAVALAALHVCYRRPPPGRWRQHAAGGLVLLAVTLPWPLYVGLTVPQAWDLWRFESLGGLTDNVENVRPWYFYLGAVFQMPLPWTPLLVVGLAFPFLRRPGRGRSRLLFPLAWYAATLLIFSLSAQKKNAYLLPTAPAQTMLIAEALIATAFLGARSKPKPPARAMVNLMTGVAVVGSIGVIILVWKYEQSAKALGLVLAALSLLAALAAIRLSRRPRSWLAGTALAFGCAVFVAVNFVQAPMENRRSAKAFSEAAREIVSAPGASVLLKRRPPEASFYLPLDLRYRLGAREQLMIVDDRRKLSKKNPDFFASRVDDARVVAAEQVEVQGVPREGRWKLVRVTIDPSRPPGDDR